MGCSVSKDSSSVPIRDGLTSVAPPASESSASGLDEESLQEAERVSPSSLKSGMTDRLSIVHFNDVYDVLERKREPVGGAARFKAKVDSVRKLNPLIVFSGDCLNPSPSKYM